MSDTHEHLEHAEHAQHAAHDPFDRPVALTIAIIAAVLATVTLLSHRAHNATLQAQIEAGILHTQATDKWNEFQANNIRRHEYEADAHLIDVLAKEPGQEQEAVRVRDDWKNKVARYEGSKGGDGKTTGKLDQLSDEAKGLVTKAAAKERESHFAHEQGSRFDLGELAVELGLVFCSVALLTKRRAFWHAGMTSAGLGALIAATVLFLSPPTEGHGAAEPAPEHQAPGH